MDHELFKKVDAYINGLFVKEDEVLEKARLSITEANCTPALSVSPSQGKFLYLLAKLTNPKKILEIGTLVGYSTIWLARALLPSGRLITLEADAINAGVAQRNIVRAGLEKQVDIRIVRALNAFPQIIAEGIAPFDMIFIDADKPLCSEYLEWAIKLSKPGTVIIINNVIPGSNSTNENATAIQRFNELLATNKAVTATIIQNVGINGHDGMALAIVN